MKVDQPTGTGLLCGHLADCGVEFAAVCPGSRSAPLALAIAADSRIHAVPVIDERAAGFMALGAAKASGQTALVITTSGTAAANLAPAIHEAREARVPLIVITADRPPELRGIGEGQTIDQVGMFTSAAPCLSLDDGGSAEDWLALARKAWELANATRPGPVQINLTLRPPLNEAPPAYKPRAVASAIDETAADSCDLTLVREAVASSKRPQLLAGRDERGVNSWIADFAAQAGIPLIADPLSAVGHGATRTAHWDLILSSTAWAQAQIPDLILRVGDLPTSKPLRSWLQTVSQAGATIVQFDPELSMRDPDRTTTIRCECSLESVIGGFNLGDLEPGWAAAWQRASKLAEAQLAETVGPTAKLSEPAIAAELLRCTQAGTTLFISASMPIRDTESFGVSDGSTGRVLSNRGANGIDGVIATAIGASVATDSPVRVLIGDVAFVHDHASLMLLRDTAANVTIVLIDNSGGTIFQMLPIASTAGDAFERFFLTPTRLPATQLAQAWGIKTNQITSLDQLRQELRESDGPQLLWAQTDGEESHQLRRAARKTVTDALEQQLS